MEHAAGESSPPGLGDSLLGPLHAAPPKNLLNRRQDLFQTRDDVVRQEPQHRKIGKLQRPILAAVAAIGI